MPEPLRIRERPPQSSVVALLEAQGLPAADLTEAHLRHFFFIGTDGAPSALVGLEIYGEDALLRSLVVSAAARAQESGADRQTLPAYSDQAWRLLPPLMTLIGQTQAAYSSAAPWWPNQNNVRIFVV